ncbi:MAG TPA: ABC transporter substrate-binding protein [Chromatiaceae bacterium]|nr:MAG: amino acid ABC transporter substrate-binding protein [Thiohalocapsa sp. PB-PSB1]HBG95285.1 ABC transporter substrate-binding protein [Chromatiaceae bacterium]HCS88615.1 ABC transporter substrate-binding protein [Chromatiaceae bacterium]
MNLARSCTALRSFRSLLAVLLWAASLFCVVAGADTLDEVKANGKLRCGVNGDAPGLSLLKSGVWSGLDVDFCRAVAAAALGDANKVSFIPLNTEERFSALRSGRVDLLARNTTWTGYRDLTAGIHFVGILYFDGQAFMVPRTTSLFSTLELDGAKICAIDGTTSMDNARRYFTRHRMRMQMNLFPDIKSAQKAYLAGKCSTLTSDRSQLYGLRATLKEPHGQRILPEVISREPLGPAVRKAETRWFDLVRWTLYTLINAEELGIDSNNVFTSRARATSQEVRTLLDLDGETSTALGIEKEWGYRVILQVGNYAEMFERNLGAASELNIKRGLNSLWNQGGLLYAPPAR